MLKVHWGSDVLALSPCRAEMSNEGLVWKGKPDRVSVHGRVRVQAGQTTQG